MGSRVAVLIIGFLVLGGCEIVPLSEQVFGEGVTPYQHQDFDQSAEIMFSADKKYESEKGVPLEGEPVICNSSGVRTAASEEGVINPISVRAGEEIAVTSIIKWNNGGWEKTCWPLVKFVPEKGASYVVVNEKIGGKGISMLWTGVALQSCEVSIFKVEGDSFSRIEAAEVNIDYCDNDATGS